MTVTPMPRNLSHGGYKSDRLRCLKLDRVLECNVGSTNIVQLRDGVHDGPLNCE